jgi:hypothetical protein
MEALQNNDNLRYLIVFNVLYCGIFFGQLPGNGDSTRAATAILNIHAQSYPQFLCIRKQIAYAAIS